jgi:hypothetical protein
MPSSTYPRLSSSKTSSTVNVVENMYKQLRKNENQLKVKLANNLKAQVFLRNIISMERKANASSVIASRFNNVHPFKRATMLNSFHRVTSSTATATTTSPKSRISTNSNNNYNQDELIMKMPRYPTTTTTTTTASATTEQPQVRMNLTTPVKYDHFDVNVVKPLGADQDGSMSLVLNVKNKSSTDVRFCVTFTNAQGKSICVWPIVSETFKDLCDFEMLEGKKEVDIELSTRQIPEEYLKFDGEKPLTLSIILTSHTIMASTITEVVQLQRQYHSLLRQQQQQAAAELLQQNRDGFQCNALGRTAIIRLQGLQLSQSEQRQNAVCY